MHRSRLVAATASRARNAVAADATVAGTVAATGMRNVPVAAPKASVIAANVRVAIVRARIATVLAAVMANAGRIGRRVPKVNLRVASRGRGANRSDRASLPPQGRTARHRYRPRHRAPPQPRRNPALRAVTT
jgi:hypothetical protein